MPFSKQVRDLYFHWNAGLTHLPSAEGIATTHNLLTPRIAASGIWRVKPMLNLMLEGVFEWPEEITGTATERTRAAVLVPGFRGGWNAGSAQAIVGVGVPVTFAQGKNDAGVFGYFSYELPFLRTQ